MRTAAALAVLLLAAAALPCSWAATTPASTAISSDTEQPILPVGTAAINLIPDGPITLSPNDFGKESQQCSSQQTIRGAYDGFTLPEPSDTFSILVGIQRASCQGTGGQPGVLLGLPDADLSLDCNKRAVTLSSSSGLGTIRYALPSSLPALPTDLTLVLTRDQRSYCSLCQPALTLCINGQYATPDASAGGPLLAALKANNQTLLSGGLAIGARSDAQRSANATISHLWVAAGATLPCSAVTTGLAGLPGVAAPTTSPPGAVPVLVQGLQALQAANSLPVVESFTQGPEEGDVFVGDAVQFAAAASDADGDDIRLSLTFFGLVPKGCSSSECGDYKEQATMAGGSGNITALVSYPRPGRYIVRLQVSDMRGSLITQDRSILVRKQGDTARLAPCCRTGSYVVAQQLGRPLHETQFRPAMLDTLAAQLGWDKEYMQAEDLEAERLFDFGILAPPVAPSPLTTVTCQDTRLAGAGSPVVYGSTVAIKPETQGHAKKLAIVPQAFPWAKDTQVACQRHWSRWQETSPYQVATSNGDVCSVGCTKAATEQLMRTTGMFSQYNEALIAASYGQLSLNPEVLVLPELVIGQDLNYTDLPYGVYEQPALQALADRNADFWRYMVLSPLLTSQVPPFRAWSGGMAAKNAIITQCYPTAYYSVHETGHSLGFRHANMYRLANATQPGSDPLGPGQLTTSGYSNSIDGMAGPHGEYGLYNRIMAGWVGGSQRRLLTQDDLAQPGSQQLMLWPFDRAESRGNLMGLTIRRSDNEVLVVGYRSASHWQDARRAASAGGVPAPEDLRANVAGLSVELLRRDPATGAWSESGQLDFNVLHGDFPEALPATPGAFPRKSYFSLLKPGYSWYDASSGLLLALESVGPCQGAAGSPVYNYTASSFYGFRGEYSGAEAPERLDYSGFQSLDCAMLVVKTAAAPPSGKLDFSVSVSTAGAAQPDTAPATASNAVPLVASRRLQQAPAASSSSSASSATTLAALACASPTLSLDFATAADASGILSITWKDSFNRTLAFGPGLTTFKLPAVGCASAVTCPDPLLYHVHALASDGRHTHATLRLRNPSPAGVDYAVDYKFYEPSGLSYDSVAGRVDFPQSLCIPSTTVAASPSLTSSSEATSPSQSPETIPPNPEVTITTTLEAQPLQPQPQQVNGQQGGAPAPARPSSSGGTGIPIAAVAGAGAGCGVLAIALAVLCVCLRRRARQLKAELGAAEQQPKGAQVQVEGA